MPHCDSDVLHAPGECVYCDDYPDMQMERAKTGVNFTGHGLDPATAKRSLSVINRWHGNIPMTLEQQANEDGQWDHDMEEAMKRHNWTDD